MVTKVTLRKKLNLLGIKVSREIYEGKFEEKSRITYTRLVEEWRDHKGEHNHGETVQNYQKEYRQEMRVLKHLQGEEQHHSDGGEQKDEDAVDDEPRQPTTGRKYVTLQENIIKNV